VNCTYSVIVCYVCDIRGFDTKEKKELYQLTGDKQVENLRITSDDKLLAASFGSGDVRLYDLEGRKEVHHFDNVHEGGIWGMALAANDNLLATGGKDTHAYVFDLGARKRVHDLKHPA